MKKFDQWYFPDNEKHLQKWMQDIGDNQHGRLTYQGQKYRHAARHCSHRRVAVDVGAHIGLWSYFMAKDFDVVYAFEPMREHIDCWRENMKGINNAELHPIALGEHAGFANMKTYTEGSSGDTRIIRDEQGDVPVFRLDDYIVELKLDALDLLKVDCEGFELPILRGAEHTLLTFKPFIVVEQKPGHAEYYGLPRTGAVDYLLSLGAKQFSADGGDYFFKWE